MEFIPASNLKKYNDIVEQIKAEYEKYEELKRDIERENDNLILSQLASSSITQKLCHLNIQIFENFVDLYNLYGEDLCCEFSSMHKLKHYKFYLVEVFITKSLLQKAKGLKCMLHISVKNVNLSVNNTIALTNNSPVREVLPVANSILDSTVEASLAVPSGDKWMVIILDTAFIDISYHFQVHKEQPKKECETRDILQITESYNKGTLDQDFQYLLTLQKKIFCAVETEVFISTVLKNCYHSLDVELFLNLKNKPEKNFVLKLACGDETFNLIFNKREEFLTIEGNIYILNLLKNYFCKEFYHKVERNKAVTLDMPKMLQKLKNMSPDAEDVRDFFCEVRESWSKLPI